MKRTQFFLVILMVLLVTAVTMAMAATNPDDPAQSSTEYTVKWRWYNGFRFGETSSADPILVKVGSGEFVSVAVGDTFTYAEGDAIEIKVKRADCFSYICCDIATESGASAAMVEYVDENAICTITGRSGNLELFLNYGIEEGYFPVEYRSGNSLVSEYYKREGISEITLASPAELGFTYDGLTFIGWKEYYANEEDGLSGASTAYALPDYDFSAIVFEAIWSCGVMDCEDTDEYPLWINGVKVTESNHTDIFGDGTVSYDAGEKTLTFNNADFFQTKSFLVPKEGWVASKGIDLTVKGNVRAGNNASIRVYEGVLICDGITIADDAATLLFGSEGLLLKGINENPSLQGGFSIEFYLSSGKDITFSETQTTVYSVDDIPGDLSIITSEVVFDGFIRQPDETNDKQNVTITNSNVTFEGTNLGNVVIRDSNIAVSGNYSSFVAYNLQLIGGKLSVGGNTGGSVAVRKTFTVKESENEVAFSVKGEKGAFALLCSELVLGDGVSVRTPLGGKLYMSEWNDIGQFQDANGQPATSIMIVSDSAYQVVLDYSMIDALDTRLWDYEYSVPTLKTELFVTGGSKLPVIDWKDFIDHPAEMSMEGWMAWLESNLIFEGWYKDRQRTELFDFDTPITENTILYGKWSDGTVLTEEDYLDIESAFPDEVLRTYVNDVIDVDADGKLTPGERSGIFTLRLSGMGIENLTGVSCFTNLRQLYCDHNKLTELNIGVLPLLEMLDCSDNLLTKVDVSNQPWLGYLNCSRNQITEIKVNSTLFSLDCYENKIESLDFLSGLTWFGALNCGNNLLTEFDLSGMDITGWVLDVLNCEGNMITSLDLSMFPDLKSIDCSDNQITELILGEKNNLSQFECCNNRLTEIDLSGFSGWWDAFDCQNNLLETLAIPDSLYINYLRCDYNKLTSITVGTSVSTLNCTNNLLTSIHSIIGVENLSGLDVSDNPITEVDLAGLSNLTSFICCQNELSSISVEGSPNLLYLWVGNCGLTSLDVSMLTELQNLSVCGNKLTSLNLENCVNLDSLFVSDNPLTELILPKNLSKLYWLDISFTDLETIDISACANLTNMACIGTKLTTLDISQNTNLKYFYADSALLSGMDFSGNTSIRWVSACDEDEEEGCVLHIQDIQSEEDNSYDNLKYVKMGDEVLERDKDYWSRRGSTIIVFSDEINEKLKAQSYEIRVVFTENDQEVVVSTNVKAREVETTQQGTGTEVTPAVDPGTPSSGETENPGTTGESGTQDPATSENQGTQEPTSSENQGTQEPATSENQGTQEPTSSENQGTQEPATSENQGTQEPTSSENQGTQEPASSENQGTQEQGSSEDQGTNTPTPEPNGTQGDTSGDKQTNTPTPTPVPPTPTPVPRQDSEKPTETPTPTPTEAPVTPMPTEVTDTPTPTAVEEVAPTEVPKAPSSDGESVPDKSQSTGDNASKEKDNKDSNGMLWIVIAIILGAGLVTTVVVVKKSGRR